MTKKLSAIGTDNQQPRKRDRKPVRWERQHEEVKSDRRHCDRDVFYARMYVHVSH